VVSVLHRPVESAVDSASSRRHEADVDKCTVLRVGSRSGPVTY